jgi:hypothetical protein
MNIMVLCRDWQGIALDRLAVGAAKRVIYIRDLNTSNDLAREPIGFPKRDVFSYCSDLAGKRLSDTEWAKLVPLEWMG